MKIVHIKQLKSFMGRLGSRTRQAPVNEKQRAGREKEKTGRRNKRAGREEEKKGRKK